MRKKKKQKGKVWTKHSFLSLFLRIEYKGNSFEILIYSSGPRQRMWLCLTWNQARSPPALAHTGLRCLHLQFSFLFYIHILFYCEIGYFLQKIFLSWIFRKETASRSLHPIIPNIIPTVTTAGGDVRGNDDNISIVFLQMVSFKPPGGSCRPQDASSTLSATTCTLDPYAKVTRVKFSSR